MASLTQYRSIKNYFKNSSVVLWEHWTSNNAKTARICAPSLVFFSKGLHTWGGKWILEILSKIFFSNSRLHWLPVVSLFPLLEPSLVLVSDLTKQIPENSKWRQQPKGSLCGQKRFVVQGKLALFKMVSREFYPELSILMNYLFWKTSSRLKTDNEEISELIRFDIRKQPSLRHL